MLISPEANLKNDLDQKPSRQESEYIAQIDFRFDLGMCWDIAQERKGVQAYVKIILPPNTQEKVRSYLESFGITHEYLFPSTIFDPIH